MAVIASLSISLDGFYTAPDPSPQHPLGADGEALHRWFSHEVADRRQLTAEDILRPEFQRLGAMVMGRDSYEHAQEAWGPHPPFEAPLYVLTHRGRAADARQGSTFHFVTEGFDAALDHARAAAGGKDVALHGGGAIQQGLASRALDELQLHIVPVVLGTGRRLFENLGQTPIGLDVVRVAEGPGVTHLKYHIPRP